MQAQQGQRGLCNEGNNVSAPRATMPAWQGQQHQRNGANTTAQLGQQHWCNDGDNAHAMWEQRGQRNKDDNTGATKATMPVQCWWWHQRNKGSNVIVTMAKTPAHWRWQWSHCDKGNDTSLKTATTPLCQGQQQYCNNGKDA
jgi:hypothetical protein